jgi:SAM-dependent methyltransferase
MGSGAGNNAGKVGRAPTSRRGPPVLGARLATISVKFDGDLASGYATGRELPATTVQMWVDAAAQHVPPGPEPVLDLGAGTGRFSAALARRLGTGLIALEPSAEMRRQIAALPGFVVVAGRAEQLPLRSSAVRAVWASQVIHHIIDFRAFAAEIRRVLRADGSLIVRGGFADRERPPTLYRYFPALAAQAGDGTAALDAARAALGRVGLRQVVHEALTQVVAADLTELHAQVRLRARSPLVRLTDEQFAVGLRRLHEAALAEAEEMRSGRATRPVVDAVDLVVFRGEPAAG